MISSFFLWFISLLSLLCDRDDKFRTSLSQRAEIIVSVKEYFRSGCVFFVESPETESRGALFKEGLIMKQKLLSALEVTTSTLSLHQNVSRVQCNRNRSLFVVNSLQYLQDLQVMKDHVSDNVWLLFLDTASPLEEIFAGINIPFDCEFLVAQPEDGQVVVLTEVYRVNSTFPLETYRFGTWSPDEGLTWPEVGLYERRNNLQGLVLRTGFKNKMCTPETVTECDRSGPSGFYMFIWSQLEKEMNFTSDYYEPKDNAYGSLSASGNWTGVVGMLHRHEVEVCNADLTLTAHRQDVVDFTVPLLSVRYYLVIKASNSYELNWDVFLDPFSGGLWKTIFVTIIVCSMCLTATYHLRQRYGLQEGDKFSIMTSAFLTVGVFCAQGHSISTRSTTIRLIFLVAYLTAVVLIASYSAAFISFLTLRNPTLPFTNFRGFLRDGTYKLITVQNSAQLDYFKNSRVELLKNIYRGLVAPHEENLPNTDIEALRSICLEENKYAVFGSPNVLWNLRGEINCTMALIPDAFFPANLAIATTKHNPYRRLFNYRLQTMRRNGILNSQEILSASYKLENTPKTLAPSISLTEFLPIMWIVLGGIILACVLLAMEKIVKPNLKETKVSQERNEYRVEELQISTNEQE